MGRHLRYRPYVVAATALAAACFWSTAAVLAQMPEQAQQIPGSAIPGQIEKQFRPLPIPRSTEEPEIRPSIEPAQPPGGADKVRFTLGGIVVEDATVFSTADFEPLYRDLVGKEVTLKQVYDVAAAITAKYGQAGYALSLAIVPAQRINGGKVRIKVIEGYVDQIFIRAEDGKSLEVAQLKAYGAKISAARPLKQSDLERYLLLANDVPGIKARAVLAPSQTPGASNLTLVVAQKSFDGYAGLDNRGSTFVGPYQGQFVANLNNALGLSERTGVRFINAYPVNQLHYFEINHQEQIGAEGTRIGLIALTSWSNPGSTLGQFDINSTNLTGSLQLYHPLIRSRAENLSMTGKFDVEQLKSTALGNTVLLSDDRLRILRGLTTYDFIDTLWQAHPAINLIAFEVSQGIDVFGASAPGSSGLSRAGMQPDFTKANIDLSRSQPLTDKFNLLLAARAQFAFAKLPASEEFGFGGSAFGRGYEPSELIGDHGITAKIEVQYNQPTCLQGWISGACQFYGFVDAGWVWTRDPTPSQLLAQNGVSVGVGARFSLNERLQGYLELALPLQVVNSAQQSREPRLFFSLVVPF